MITRDSVALVLPFVLITAGTWTYSIVGSPRSVSQSDTRFGRPEDVEFAEKAWSAMKGYEDWKLSSDVYPGKSPHGDYLRMFSTWIGVDGTSYPVLVKDNYAGEGVSRESAKEDRDAWLGAVTVMVRRNPGFDPAHGDWFYVKYEKDGTVAKTEDGEALAGRVDGCVRCHADAKGNDYLFSNDS